LTSSRADYDVDKLYLQYYSVYTENNELKIHDNLYGAYKSSLANNPLIQEVVDKIATTVALTVDSMISFKDSVSVEEIQDIVENALIKYELTLSDSFDMSKEYIRYRHKRNNIHILKHLLH